MEIHYYRLSYTVSFARNGAESGNTIPQTFMYGENKYLNANKDVKPSYAFAGWNTKADGTGKSYGNMASSPLHKRNLLRRGKLPEPTL